MDPAAHVNSALTEIRVDTRISGTGSTRNRELTCSLRCIKIMEQYLPSAEEKGI